MDKTALQVDGRSLLERTVDAVSGACPIVVVGPRRALDVEVTWTRERPPGGGPLAALAAGLTAVPATDLVAVLAADHPYLTAATMQRLVAAVSATPGACGAVLTDGSGRAQWLVGVWRWGPLCDRMPAEVQQRPVRGVLAELNPELVPAVGAEASDIDTPADWHRVVGQGGRQ